MPDIGIFLHIHLRSVDTVGDRVCCRGDGYDDSDNDYGGIVFPRRAGYW